MSAENVAAIILTYEDVEKTMNCVKAVHNQTEVPRRIILCDNGSGNEIADEIFQKWIEFTQEQNLASPVEVYENDRSGANFIFLRLEENKGVATGFNEALRFVLYDKECEFFWLMHNDTEPENYVLSALLQHLGDESEKKIGLVGSTLFYKESGLQECAAGGYWRKWVGKAKNLDCGFDKFAHTERKEIVRQLDYVCGASFLVTRELINTIGLFEERLCMFYEDVEYGLRAKKAGFALNWAPGARVLHYAPNAVQLTPLLNITDDPELSAERDYFYIRNRFYIMRKENSFTIFLSFIFIFTLFFSRKFKGYKGRIKPICQAVFDGINNKLYKTLK